MFVQTLAFRSSTNNCLKLPAFSRKAHTLPLIHTVLAQHAEEAAILWLLRDHAVCEPHYSLADLANLDDRLEAHIDGLRIAGEEGWKLCAKELAWEEPGEVFAAAMLALDSGLPERIEPVVEIGCSSPELQRGLISAAAWNVGQYSHDLLKRLIESDQSTCRRVGVAAYAGRREDPGQLLFELVRDEDPLVRARSLRAIGELGRLDLSQVACSATSDDDDACRFWAAWTAARLSGRSGAIVGALREFAQRPGRFTERAVAISARTTKPDVARKWLGELWKDPTLMRAATIGAGVLGDPELVDTLFQMMQVEAVARVAGEAFSMITGVDLAYDDLDQDTPEGFQSGPNEDPEDENVALDPDENLPWPNHQLVAKWWSDHRGDFQSGQRYLCGREISVESLGKTLVDGNQRQRAAAALELAILQPGKPLFNVCAPGFRQQHWLSGK